MNIRIAAIGVSLAAAGATIAIGVLAQTATTRSAERAQAAIACKPTGEKFTYDCTIALKAARSGEAIDKAEIVVGADMPSMPMAHNVKPVAGKPTEAPGTYAARLVLEMHGDWAVSVTVDAPFRDKIVRLLNFTPTKVTEAKPGSRPAAHGGRHHQH